MPVLLRWFLRLGPTNPIAVRLVSNGSRRLRHHYIRIGYLGALIVVLLYALLLIAQGSDQLDYRKLAAGGATSFAWIAYMQIGLICVLAPVFMAGAIAQEADPRTWDILLTTPLGASEIVLGNLFGRLFFILGLLASSLPLFAVTQYFGGVPGESIFASYLISGCAAVLVGTMAIGLSVSRLVGRRAVFAFYVSVVSYLAVTYAIDAMSGAAGGVTWMTAINPFLALRALLDPKTDATAGSAPLTGVSYWFLQRPVMTWCVLSAGLSVALAVASIITVRIGGLAGIGVGGTVESSAPWYKRLLGRKSAGETHRAPRTVWHNPVAWREAAARNATFGRIAARWSFIVIGIGWACAMLWMHYRGVFRNASELRGAVYYTALGEMGVICLVAINMAATAVSREREDGTLDILLTTPIQAGKYLMGKLQGIVAYLLPMLAVPVMTVGLAGLYVVFDAFGGPSVAVKIENVTSGPAMGFGGVPPGPGVGASMPTAPAVLPEAIVLLPLVLIPFTAFCVMVGMMWSVRSRGTISAVMVTVGIVAAIGGTVGLCAWNAAASVQVLGPMLGAMSPASLVNAVIYPELAMSASVTRSGGGFDLMGARTALFIGAVISACVHIVTVWSLQTSMTRTFDATVRKLAGMK